MTMTMIWAQGLRREIGLGNGLPWNIPEDMKHFRGTTTGSIVVMGGKTYRTLGRPLANRTNVVITRETEPSWIEHDEVLIFNSVASFLNHAQGKNVYIIGGQEIFSAFMRHADKLIVTQIFEEFEADTFAPRVDPDVWKVDRIKKSDKLHFIYYTKL